MKESIWTEPLLITTDDLILDTAIIDVMGTITYNSAVINWESVDNAEGYKLYLYNTTDSLVIHDNLDLGNILTYNITGLYGHTDYEYKIKAYGHGVESSYSLLDDFITLDPIPDTPTMSSSTSITSSSFVANWSTETYADSYNVYVYTDISLTNLFVSYTGVLTNSKNVTGLDPVTNYYTVVESVNESGVSAKSGYILTTTEINNLQIDAYTLIALDLGEGSGSTLNPTTPTTIEATIDGDNTSIWQSSSISDYSLDLNGTDNYIYTDVDNTTLTDFTFRIPFRFDTGDKLAKSLHILGAKYNTTGSNILGFIITLEYYSGTNELILTINDESGSWGSFTYRQFTHIYDFNENEDYIVQASFKLDDPSNSNLNTAEICVNGVKLTGGTWTDAGISNISTIQNSNIPYTFGAYVGASGIPSLSQFKAHKFYFDTCFRSEVYGLQDAKNIGLA